MCDAVLMTRPRPLAIPGQPDWAPSCIFISDSDTGDGFVTSGSVLSSGSQVALDGRDAGGPGQSTARPAARAGTRALQCERDSVASEVRRVRHASGDCVAAIAWPPTPQQNMPKSGGREGDIPLPPGWDFGRDYDNKLYFIDHNNQKTTWVDPRDR